jgi:hypothetical protein
MKITKLIIIILLILLIPIQVFSLESRLSPNGKMLSISEITGNVRPTMGVDSTDDKIHKYHVILYILDEVVFEETVYRKHYRKLLDRNLSPFSHIRFIIIADDTPLLAYHLYTDGNGNVKFHLANWL